MTTQFIISSRNASSIFPTPSTMIPRKTCFNYTAITHLRNRGNGSAFFSYIHEDKACFDVYEWSSRMNGNLNRLIKSAAIYNNDEEEINWQTIFRSLSRKERGATNCSPRMNYLFDKEHFFVKKNFTFGLRYVTAGTIHLFQLTENSMNIFIIPNRLIGLNFPSQYIPTHNHRDFHKIHMHANTAFKILPNTYYITVSNKSMYFSLHILHENVELPFPVINTNDEFITSRKTKRRVHLNPPLSTKLPSDETMTEEQELQNSSSTSIPSPNLCDYTNPTESVESLPLNVPEINESEDMNLSNLADFDFILEQLIQSNSILEDDILFEAMKDLLKT